MTSDFMRKNISRFFTKQDEMAFTNAIPNAERIYINLHSQETIGLYLHIPFCDRICPYCPYNKEVYSVEKAEAYTQAIIKEIDIYAELLENKEVSSFYIGGGTPTTLLNNGMDKMISHIYKKLNMQCKVHMESHPNHLSQENLNTIKALNVDFLSIGIEALQDHHLKNLERPYSVNEALKIIDRAAQMNFNCINIDYIFDLPHQTKKEIIDAGLMMVNMGIQQVATYPLFNFPYTRFGKIHTKNQKSMRTMFRRRKYLKLLEKIFYDNDFERSSVWAFTRKGTDKYCSVTVPTYFGLGASGGSYLKDVFYINTFNVDAYIEAMNSDKSPIAVAIDLSIPMQMSGWLYWRIYETKFNKSDFEKRFSTDFDEYYLRYMEYLEHIGFVTIIKDKFTLTDRGTYWIHAFEDFFSIDYINKLWGTSRSNPWPKNVKL